MIPYRYQTTPISHSIIYFTIKISHCIISHHTVSPTHHTSININIYLDDVAEEVVNIAVHVQHALPLVPDPHALALHHEVRVLAACTTKKTRGDTKNTIEKTPSKYTKVEGERLSFRFLSQIYRKTRYDMSKTPQTRHTHSYTELQGPLSLSFDLETLHMFACAQNTTSPKNQKKKK